jgi:hypothetical protein
VKNRKTGKKGRNTKEKGTKNESGIGNGKSIFILPELTNFNNKLQTINFFPP